eukprot:TRINITY_DN3105_c0_g2_i1.p1 TRINITY_DN3105_c0_g2~~TRINITY_DN3105_c0_g2_i1.p1  ORF type:complete len:616 (+),score=131.68 TRINITY_DN3105_c0_g2_i1:291-2138(+)
MPRKRLGVSVIHFFTKLLAHSNPIRIGISGLLVYLCVSQPVSIYSWFCVLGLVVLYMMGDHASTGNPAEDLEEKGDAALLTKDFAEAKEQFTQALKELSLTGDDAPGSRVRARLLCKRARTLIETSIFYRARSPVASEREPLFGADPEYLCEQALTDLQLVRDHSGGPLPEDWNVLMGDALFQLEQYEGARQHYQQGADADPHNEAALFGLFKVDQVMGPAASSGGSGRDGSNARKNKKKKKTNQEETIEEGGPSASSMGTTDGDGGHTLEGSPTTSVQADDDDDDDDGCLDDLLCKICSTLLYDPVTTRCGHSFCKQCLMRALDHTPKCPVCRTTLLSGAFATSLVLKNVIQHLYPEQYERRAHVHGVDGAAGAGTGASPHRQRIPVFVVDDLLPGCKIQLHVFEPRYRLMVRRVMAGSGMMVFTSRDRVRDSAAHSDDNQVTVQYGGCAEIRECRTLPDGRYMLEAVCVKRVKFGNLDPEDGYLVATVEDVDDEAMDTESGSVDSEFIQVRDKVLLAAHSWRQSLTEAKSSPGRSGHIARVLLERCGPKPREDDLVAMSYWVLTMIPPGAATVVKRDGVEIDWAYEAMSLVKTEDRWKLAQEVYEALESRNWL